MDADVIIVGAGIAGIAAAKTLSENGVTDFIILEAESRIGGRLKSTVLNSTSLRVELGANWIQGIDPKNPWKHPLWAIAERCGGLEGNFVKDFNNGTMHVFDEDGSNISDSKVFKQKLSQWNKILGLLSTNRSKAGLPDITVRSALNYLGWKPSSPLDDLIEWYGFDLDELAIAPDNSSLYLTSSDDTYSNFGNVNRTENYFVNDQKEGFEKVVRCLSKEFLTNEDKRLMLKTVVIEIDWSNSDYVCVKTRQESILKEYCAPHAIITFGLGVLQSNAVQFLPLLPESKQSAINSCIFVVYLKIFLEFDSIFWKNETMVDNFLYVDKIRGHFCQFQPVKKDMPVIFTTVTDTIAKSIYTQPKQDIINQIMKPLRLIYGKDIPDPLEVTIPDWYVNPLYHGTYTSPPIGCNISQIAQSVGRLYFAGEATSERYYGYAHGAYYSGINTAKNIINSQP